MAITANVLAIDTSTHTGLVALKFAGQIYSRSQEEPREHNRFLLPMIEEVLAEAKIKLNELDALICGNGPGSFVGVRLGVAVMQGLAYATQKPIYPLSSLALQAQAFFRTEPMQTEVIIVQDARMQALYFAHYRNNKGLAELVGKEKWVPLTMLKDLALPQNVKIIGSAIQYFPKANGLNALSVQAQDLVQQGTLSLQQRALAADELQPVYLNDESNWQKHN